MTFEQLTQYLSWAIYTLIFVLVTVKAVRRPTQVNVDIALFFTMPAASIALSVAIDLGLIQTSPFTEILSATFLFAMAYTLFRLVDDFAQVPTWLSPAALAGFVLSILTLLVFQPPRPSWLSILQVIYITALFVYSVMQFLRASRHASGVTLRRMRSVAFGSFALVILFVIAGLTVFFPQWSDILRPLTDLTALISAAAYFLGFATPEIVRRAWQEPELRAFLGRAASLPNLPDTQSIIQELERGTAASVGAPNASIGLWDPQSQTLHFHMKDHDLRLRLDETLAGRVYKSQKPLFTDNAARDNPGHGDLQRAYDARTALIAPVTAGDKRLGVLAAYASRAPIFAEEDLALVQLLADQAAVILESRALIDEATHVQAREQVARMKEDFLSAAAHDLKTPLTTLVMQVELLERRAMRAPDAPTDIAALGKIKKEAHRLKSLVLELLDAARAEQGRLVGELEQVDLAAVAQDVCARHSSPTHPCTVQAAGSVTGTYDPNRIGQLLENLVENAVKYSPDGGSVTISVGCLQSGAAGVLSKVPLPGRPGLDSAGWNHIAVSDSGIGIPRDDLPHVFERFHRGSNVDDRQFVGMGLGLYICRGIVEQHGGIMWVESPASTPTASSERAAGAFLVTNGTSNQNDLKDTKLYAHQHNSHGSTFHVLLPALPVDAAEQPAALDVAGRAAQG
jgi:signal transduction histidine kinase